MHRRRSCPRHDLKVCVCDSRSACCLLLAVRGTWASAAVVFHETSWLSVYHPRHVVGVRPVIAARVFVACLLRACSNVVWASV